MIERFFDNLLEFEPLWTALAYIAVWTIGLSIVLVGIMIFVRVIESFIGFVRNHSRYISGKCKNATNRFLDKVGSRIGQAVKTAIADFNRPPMRDMREEIVGLWESADGDRMEIVQHEGYFTLRFRECPSDTTMVFESFILRYPQGWLCDDNVYFAEGKQYFSLAVSDSADEIYISELRQTFKRYVPSGFEEIMQAVEECRKRADGCLKSDDVGICFGDVEESDVVKDNILE